jgi:hypothetical protein
VHAFPQNEGQAACQNTRFARKELLPRCRSPIAGSFRIAENPGVGSIAYRNRVTRYYL